MTREKYLSELLEHYSVVNLLSDKNDGKVLRLRSKALGKDIILRSYPERISAYTDLCSIKCENLSEVYDSIDLEDGQIVLEEYIDGMTLADVMSMGKHKRRGVQKIIRSVCNALSVLHSKSIIHRDIKPENVMIDKNGRVVLIDMNASRKMNKASRDTVVMGTVGYASPEQLGIAQSDVRTDVYALGVLLNVMVTGKHPSERLACGHYGRIVRKCTDIDPGRRFQSAESLAEAI